MNRFILRGTLIGIISGVLLGLFLKWIESLTGFKVYTLLLNVDYITFLNELHLNELADFSLHLIVSIALVIVIMILIQIRKWNKRRQFWHVIWINGVIGLLLYPMTTVLSERTPEIFDIGAISWWVIGHLLYGVIVAIMLQKKVD